MSSLKILLIYIHTIDLPHYRMFSQIITRDTYLFIFWPEQVFLINIYMVDNLGRIW